MMRRSNWLLKLWPLLLCAATAGATLACVRLGDRRQHSEKEKVMIEHVRVKSDKPFSKVTAAFEARLGKFDPVVHQQLRNGDDPEAVRARIEAMAGPSGFMLFRTSDHGAILRLAGQQREAVQYLVGNPLFAVEMTRHAIGAALYAPLRVLLYEEDGGTCVEYDLPSSQFGQFGNEQVNRVAASLDQKLADLVTEATH
jgi:uncharacterized protein (DUF302 family)